MNPGNLFSYKRKKDKFCCTPYIMDSSSSINIYQWSIRGVILTHLTITWYHLYSGRIVAAQLDSQLPINYLLFNQVHLYLVSVTWIYMFFHLPFCVPGVFLLPASQQIQRKIFKSFIIKMFSVITSKKSLIWWYKAFKRQSYFKSIKIQEKV